MYYRIYGETVKTTTYAHLAPKSPVSKLKIINSLRGKNVYINGHN